MAGLLVALLCTLLVSVVAPTTPLRITEVCTWGQMTNGNDPRPPNAPYMHDWFELTNFGSSNFDLIGNGVEYRMDDGSHSNAADKSVLLKEIPYLYPGESVVFLNMGVAQGRRTTPSPTFTELKALFATEWWGGVGNIPAGCRIGYYNGEGRNVGFEFTSTDGIYLYDKSLANSGTEISSVTFSNSVSKKTFDNAVGGVGVKISTISAVGVNGAFTSVGGDNEIGSPCRINNPPTATPTAQPTAFPTAFPTALPTANPTATPTANPTASPTTSRPTANPTATPTASPTVGLGRCCGSRTNARGEDESYCLPAQPQATCTTAGGAWTYNQPCDSACGTNLPVTGTNQNGATLTFSVDASTAGQGFANGTDGLAIAPVPAAQLNQLPAAQAGGLVLAFDITHYIAGVAVDEEHGFLEGFIVVSISSENPEFTINDEIIVMRLLEDGTGWVDVAAECQGRIPSVAHVFNGTVSPPAWEVPICHASTFGVFAVDNDDHDDKDSKLKKKNKKGKPAVEPTKPTVTKKDSKKDAKPEPKPAPKASKGKGAKKISLAIGLGVGGGAVVATVVGVMALRTCRRQTKDKAQPKNAPRATATPPAVLAV